MRGIRSLVMLVALAAAIALPAKASAGTTYTVAGTEIDASPATFVGSLVNRVGYWKAVIYHNPLNYSGTTTITGGYFSVTSYYPYRHVTGRSTTAVWSSPARCRRRTGSRAPRGSPS